jgi:hypothetical protein
VDLTAADELAPDARREPQLRAAAAPVELIVLEQGAELGAPRSLRPPSEAPSLLLVLAGEVRLQVVVPKAV